MLEIVKIESTVKKRYRNFRYFYTNIEIVFNDVISIQRIADLKNDFNILPLLSDCEEYRIIDVNVKRNKIYLITDIPYLYVNNLGIYSLAYKSNTGIQGRSQGAIYSIEPISLDSRLLTPYVNFIEYAEVEELPRKENEIYAMSDSLRYKACRFESNFFYIKEFLQDKTYYDKKVSFRFRLWADHEMAEKLLVQFYGRIYLYVNGELCYRTQTSLKKERFLEESIQCILNTGTNEVVVFYEPFYFARKDPLNRIIGLSIRILLQDKKSVPILI